MTGTKSTKYLDLVSQINKNNQIPNNVHLNKTLLSSKFILFFKSIIHPANIKIYIAKTIPV